MLLCHVCLHAQNIFSPGELQDGLQAAALWLGEVGPVGPFTRTSLKDLAQA